MINWDKLWLIMIDCDRLWLFVLDSDKLWWIVKDCPSVLSLARYCIPFQSFTTHQTWCLDHNYYESGINHHILKMQELTLWHHFSNPLWMSLIVPRWKVLLTEEDSLSLTMSQLTINDPTSPPPIPLCSNYLNLSPIIFSLAPTYLMHNLCNSW